MSSSTTDQKPASQPKIILYWLDKSRAHRILWLLEELNLEYELKVYYRQPSAWAPPELKEIHPLGKAPILSIQTPEMEKPKVMIESAFIVEYLLDYFGKHLIPERYPPGKDGQIGAENEEWVRYRTYMHFAEGSMMPSILVKLVSGGIKNAPLPFFIKPLVRIISQKIDDEFRPTFKTHFDFLESQIASSPQGGQFLCGKELTGADIMMIFPLEASQARCGLTAEEYPKLTAYVARLHEREAYKRAIKKVEEVTGKPFDPALV